MTAHGRSPATTVDLYWLPLGAGGRSVRLNGKAFELVVSRLERRSPRDLYHAALVVTVPDGRYAIEMTPASGGDGSRRGVVATGSVGARFAGLLSLFRYEVRRWRDGIIPDIGEAVDSPQRIGDEVATARCLLDLVPSVPTPVWGRDELRTGEMWNSNSVVSWLIARSGLPLEAARIPVNGRAPGWNAGLVVARRHGQIV